MLGKPLTLFRLYGFEVKLDASWLLLALLVSWSLATAYFPGVLPGRTEGVYWSIAMLSAMGLFGSIIFHEMCHSLVARAYGLPIRGITLFIFGGVAEMEDEPQSPKVEFLMAIAGPASSYVLMLAFYSVASLAAAAGIYDPLTAVLSYLVIVNFMLATFNLIPAFPLDGGRVFRAALWRWKGNLRWATRHASRFGSAFGLGFVAIGVVTIVQGNVTGGMWTSLIGLFLHSAALSSYQQLRTRQALEGQPVARYMSRNPDVVAPAISLRELVENHVYVHGHDMFPVMDGNMLLGCINLRQIKDIPQQQWDTVQVRQIMSPCSRANMIHADEDVVQAISVMQRSGNSRLLVVDGARLVGVVALKDILQLLALKLDLETLE